MNDLAKRLGVSRGGRPPKGKEKIRVDELIEPMRVRSEWLRREQANCRDRVKRRRAPDRNPKKTGIRKPQSKRHRTKLVESACQEVGVNPFEVLAKTAKPAADPHLRLVAAAFLAGYLQGRFKKISIAPKDGAPMARIVINVGDKLVELGEMPVG